MKGYKIDTHVHTSETSDCGKVSASKLFSDVIVLSNDNY
jgi:hypothetical protein